MVAVNINTKSRSARYRHELKDRQEAVVDHTIGPLRREYQYEMFNEGHCSGQGQLFDDQCDGQGELFEVMQRFRPAA